MGRLDEFGEYDDYGMPSMAQPQGATSRTGIMGRLKRASSSKGSMRAGFGDDSDEEGVDPGGAIPQMNIRELSGLSDRHRYPTSRTMSIASTSTYDTTPIIPTLAGSATPKTSKANTQYRQRMIDQRKQLLSSETGLPMPGAPGSVAGTGGPASPRSMSGLTDPFSGFSNRAMSMSSQQRASVSSRAMSMRGAGVGAVHNLSSPVLGQQPPSQQQSQEIVALRNALDREKANSQQLRQAHQHLMAEHRHLSENQDTALEESYHALEAKYYALNEQHEQLKDDHHRLEADHTTVQQQQQRQLQQQPQVSEEFLSMHEDLKRDLAFAQQQISSQKTELTSLRQLSRDAPQEQQRLKDLNEELRSQLSQQQVQQRQAPSDSLEQLQASHQGLAAQVHSLSLELAESSRREIGLPTSGKSQDPASQLARLHAELAEERELRLVAQGHLDKPAEPSARAHAEATQLLDMRNQEYDLLLDKYNAAAAAAASASASASRDVPEHEQSNSALESQLRDLSQHSSFVESENARLQQLLDELSPKGPLSERLKSVEDQRNVLQDALRALRERKDYEIKLLGDRVKQLEGRIDSFRAAGNRAPSSASVDSDDDDLEMPRMRQQQRPASPLHINFNMDVRGHRERTNPLPLALG